ncbi:hypothetical protein ACOME3_008573 [Neoechinorhynchus agilis]
MFGQWTERNTGKDVLSISSCSVGSSGVQMGRERDQTHSDIDKDLFYEQLTDLTATAKDPLFAMGDMNAKVRADTSVASEIMGTHGIGVLNDNDERLLLVRDCGKELHLSLKSELQAIYGI